MDLVEASRRAGYEPYTEEFDRVVDIEDIYDPDRIRNIASWLADWRDTPNDEMTKLAVVVEGLRDRIADELQERGLDPRETTVSFLVDCSGSTRGTTAYRMALSTIEMCLALEALGVETTVMGYTTAAWKGGASKEKWVKDGRPTNPGRLSDLLHIVYKTPDMDMQTAIGRLSAMADDGHKRDNVDGEALMWAAENVSALERPNKILLNVTDGVLPICDSTLALNSDYFILRDHLKCIASAIEEDNRIALAAIYVNFTSYDQKIHKELDESGNQIFFRHAATDGDLTPMAEMLSAIEEGLAKGFERATEIALAAKTDHNRRF